MRTNNPVLRDFFMQLEYLTGQMKVSTTLIVIKALSDYLQDDNLSDPTAGLARYIKGDSSIIASLGELAKTIRAGEVEDKAQALACIGQLNDKINSPPREPDFKVTQPYSPRFHYSPEWQAFEKAAYINDNFVKLRKTEINALRLEQLTDKKPYAWFLNAVYTSSILTDDQKALFEASFSTYRPNAEIAQSSSSSSSSSQSLPRVPSKEEEIALQGMAALKTNARVDASTSSSSSSAAAAAASPAGFFQSNQAAPVPVEQVRDQVTHAAYDAMCDTFLHQLLQSKHAYLNEIASLTVQVDSINRSLLHPLYIPPADIPDEALPSLELAHANAKIYIIQLLQRDCRALQTEKSHLMNWHAYLCATQSAEMAQMTAAVTKQRLGASLNQLEATRLRLQGLYSSPSSSSAAAASSNESSDEEQVVKRARRA